MENTNEVTKVIFRKFKDNGEIIALFPEIAYRHNYTVLSYMHVGQHSDADYNHIISLTKLATEEEYADLKRELENHCEYNLRVVKRAKISYNI